MASSSRIDFFGHYLINSKDYDMLKKDPYFSKLLNAIAFDNALVQNRAQQVEGSIVSLIFDIENELKTKERQ